MNRKKTMKGQAMARTSLLSEERRGLTLAAADIAVTRADDDTPPRFTGHAAVFNSRTAIGNPLTWGFYEEIAAGAFSKTLAEGDARMLIDHDSYYVVARSSADTLRLAQDKIGLSVEADLDPELSYVGDLVANLRNGNITGMSFGFYVVKADWETETVETSDGNEADVDVRIIREVKLIEVSAVTFPAYEETDAGLRNHSLVPALRHRNSPDAVRRLAKFRPELAELLGDVDSEPGGSTRGDSTTDPTAENAEPVEATRVNQPSIEARMRALAARYHLPAA